MARAMAQIPPAERETWAARWLGELVPLAGPSFAAFHHAQLEGAVRAVLAAPENMDHAELTVSFVDLCGSTEYMLAASRDEIRALVDGMFFAAQDVARRHEVLVSKHLGDGVLLVGPDRVGVIEAVLDLVNELGHRTPLQAAAGVDFGTVTTRAGDHFGPPLNLASRLAEIACANEVLIGAAAVPDPPPSGTWETRDVRGLAKPHRVLRLTCPPG
jgi:class 3 adenylate cyclase